MTFASRTSLAGLVAVAVLAAVPLRALADDRLRSSFFCTVASPDNLPEPLPTEVAVLPGGTFDCRLDLATVGAQGVDSSRVWLHLPQRTVELAPAAEFPDGLPNLGDARVSGLFQLFGVYAAGHESPNSLEEDGWRFISYPGALGDGGSGATRQLRFRIQVPQSMPAGDVSLTLGVEWQDATHPLHSAGTQTFLVKIGELTTFTLAPLFAPTQCPSVPWRAQYALRVPRSGNQFLQTVQTDVKLAAFLPYWDPASQSVKADAAFDPALHQLLVDVEKLEARLGGYAGGETFHGSHLQPEVLLPPGLLRAPFNTGTNRGRIIVRTANSNRVEFRPAALGAKENNDTPSITPTFYVTLEAPFRLPAGVTQVQLAGRKIATTACVTARELTVSRCTALDGPVFGACPTGEILTYAHYSAARSGTPATCENPSQTMVPEERGLTRLSYRQLSPVVPNTLDVAIQLPGRTSRDAALDQITAQLSFGGGNAEIYLSLSPGDYASANLLSREPGEVDWVRYDGSQPLADVESVRFVVANIAPNYEAPAFTADLRWQPRDNALLSSIDPPGSTSVNSENACSAGDCTAAGYCSAARVQLSGQPVFRATATTEIDGRPKLTTGASASFVGELRPPLDGALLYELRNVGSVTNVGGPYLLETVLPAGVLLDTTRPVTSELIAKSGATGLLAGSEVQFTAQTLGNGTTRVTVTASGLLANQSGELPLRGGVPVLFGPLRPATTSSDWVGVRVKLPVFFGPGMGATNSTTGSTWRVALFETASTFKVQPVASSEIVLNPAAGGVPALSFETRLGASATGPAPRMTNPKQLPGSTFVYRFQLENPAYTDTGPLAPGQRATGSSPNTVAYVPLWREADGVTFGVSPAAHSLAFVSASGFVDPQTGTNDVVGLYVTAAASPVVGDSAGLTVANGWKRCGAIGTATVAPSCGATELAAAGFTGTPTLIAFDFGEVLVTDAEPRGRRWTANQTRINRPYFANVTVRDDASAEGSKLRFQAEVKGSQTVRAGELAKILLFRLANLPPVLEKVPTGENFIVGLEGCFPFRATDRVDLDAVFATVSAGPAAGRLAVVDDSIESEVSYLFCWTPAATDVGTRTVTLLATDVLGASSTPSIVTLTVRPNQPPVIEPMDDVFLIAGNEACVEVNATDSDDDAVTITSAPLPAGASFQHREAKGAFYELCWTPSSFQLGTRVFDFIATDAPAGATGVGSVRFHVRLANIAPEFRFVSDKKVLVGETLCLDAWAEDEDDDLMEEVAPALLPVGATFTKVTDAEGLWRYAFCWTPILDQVGVHRLELELTDLRPGFGDALTAELAVTIEVLRPNHPPVLVRPADQIGVVGAQQCVTVNASDPDMDPVTLAVETLPVNGGLDTKAPPAQLCFTPDSDGTLTILLSASDPLGLRDEKSFHVRVYQSNQAPILRSPATTVVIAGTLACFEVQATDANSDLIDLTQKSSVQPQSATSLETTTRVAGAAIGRFCWQTTENDTGDTKVSFTAIDVRPPDLADSLETNATTLISVQHKPAVKADPHFTVIALTELCVQISGVDADPHDVVLLSLVGDLPGARFFPLKAGTNEVESMLCWTPVAADIGSHTVTAVATDSPYGFTASSEIVIDVIRPDRPPALDPIAPRQVEEGETLTFTIDGRDPDGDPTTFTGDALPAGATFDAATRTFTWTPGFDQSGSWRATFSIHANGESDTKAGRIEVLEKNRAPDVDPGGPYKGRSNDRLDVSFTTTDPDGDPVTCTLADLPAGATYADAGRLVSWRPRENQQGAFDLLIACTDGQLTTTRPLHIDVVPIVFARMGGGIASGCTTGGAAAAPLLWVAGALALRRRRQPRG